jgi:hypothetical protein
MFSIKDKEARSLDKSAGSNMNASEAGPPRSGGAHDALKALPLGGQRYLPTRALRFGSAEDDRNAGGSTGELQRPGSTLPLRLALPQKDALDEPVGEIVGRGLAGEVREDPSDSAFVVKSFGGNRKAAEIESRLFNKFYGEFSSEIFEKSAQFYMRMLRVPGKPLDEWRRDELPANSRQLFVQMICDMCDLEIIHGDLHSGNVMFDEKTNRFWPIDFSNLYDDYYANFAGVAGLIDGSNSARFEKIMERLPEMIEHDVPEPNSATGRT